MLNKYICALIAGIVFGILIGITALIPCMIIIGFVLMVVLGAITVYLARGDIKNVMDALMASGLAGGISGVVSTGVAVAGLAAIVALSRYYDSDALTGYDLSRLGVFGLICCAPVLIISGVLLAGIGGYVYYEMVAKRNA
jgi:hypothetical protein